MIEAKSVDSRYVVETQGRGWKNGCLNSVSCDCCGCNVSFAYNQPVSCYFCETVLYDRYRLFNSPDYRKKYYFETEPKRGTRAVR